MNSQTMKKIKKWNIHPIPNLMLILFSLACIIPFLMLVSISVSNEEDILKLGYKLIPVRLDFTAYKYILGEPREIIDAYLVTIFNTVVGTSLSVIIMAMIAYPLSRSNYSHRKGLSFFVFFTMLFSGGLVPSYILITQYLHLKDTIWVMILPGLVGAWHVILLRTFFQSIHESLFESAKLDGASEWRIFFTIVLPLSKPALATVALLGALGRWNSWFDCMIYINDSRLFNLQYLLQRIMMQIELLETMSFASITMKDVVDVPSETVRMAMAVLAAGPMILVFPFFQKYFVKGIMVGSVKG